MELIKLLSNWQMEQPKLFGLFHIAFLLLTIAASFLLIFFFRNSSEKMMKRIVLICWITTTVLEIGKQFIFSYMTGALKYNWSEFPFQFCETPIFIMPILFFNKNKKFQNILITFLATFAFFAGLGVLMNPTAIMSTYAFLNVRHMIGHGIQVSLGLYLFAWNRKEVSLKNFLYATVIFLCLTGIALLFDAIVDPLVEDQVNMFLIYPKYESTLFVLSDIKPHVPWIIFLLFYLISFTVLASASYLVEIGVWRLLSKIKTNKN